jgi:hypothetical protein
VALGLAVAAQRQSAAVVERVDEGEEIGGVITQDREVDLELLHNLPGDLVFYGRNRVLIETFHVVPETLAGKDLLWMAPQLLQDGGLVPVPDLQFACRRQRPVDGRQQHVPAHRGPLRTLGNVSVDDLLDADPLGNTQKRGHASELPQNRLLWLQGRGPVHLFDDALHRAEIPLPHDPGPSMDPCGLDRVKIVFALFSLLDDGGHIWCLLL